MPDRPIYRGMAQAELDRAYDNRAHVTDSAACLTRWANESDAFYRSARVLRDLRYGPGDRQRLDFFPAGRAGRPTIFFIHGGYWQWCDKENEAFVAKGPSVHDINVVNVEYTLCPANTLDGIVAEIHAALDWLRPRLGELNADPEHLIVGGSSAGAHLAAMMAGRRDVKGMLLVSGIYDLEPIRLSWLNRVLNMDSETAHRNSPILQIPVCGGPVCFAVGADELPEMIRQTDDYWAAWLAAGLPGWKAVLSGVNHFTIMDDLASPYGRLTTALLRLCDERLPIHPTSPG